MTLSTTATIKDYEGDGVTDSFVGTFQMTDDASLRVTIDGVDYPSFSVEGDVAVAGGWAAVLAAAPADGTSVRLIRETNAQQLTSYPPYGKYQAEQHERDYDKLMALLQEAKYGLSNAMQIDPETGHWDARDLRITNVAEPEASDDAATKGYVDSVIASSTLGTPTPEYFVAVAAQDDFTMGFTPAAASSVKVRVNGFGYIYGEDFDVAGDVVQFAEEFEGGEDVEVDYLRPAGSYDNPAILGGAYLWTTAGVLYINTVAPANATDGTVVGAQA